MALTVEAVPFEEVEELHEHRRARAGCQIVRDSILPRGLADAWLIRSGTGPIGFGGVWSDHFPGRVMAFHVVEGHERCAEAAFRALLVATGAREVEAQTNLPLMLSMLRRFGGAERVENLLFEHARTPGPEAPRPRGCAFRERTADDAGLDGDWVVEHEGRVVAAGGVTTHYNPPYGDVYMAVEEGMRRRGIGSYLVRELIAVCRSRGLVAAARCDPANEGSRRALLRGGLEQCGRMLSAPVAL